MVCRGYKKAFSLIRANLCHSRTVLLFALLAVAYSKSPTDSELARLSGTVQFEGKTDHSGVTVALYALAELGTMVQRMNKDLPWLEYLFPRSQSLTIV